MTTMSSPQVLSTDEAPEHDEQWRQDLGDRVRAYLGPFKVKLGRPNTFDMVVTPWGPETELLLQTVTAMQQPHGCGPVLADPDRAQLYWAVPPGTAATWVYPFTVCHGRGSLLLPSPTRRSGPGPHWLWPWQPTHLVAPRVLTAALADLPRVVAVHAAQAAAQPPPRPRGDITAFFRPAPEKVAGLPDPLGNEGSAADRDSLRPVTSPQRDHGAPAGPSAPSCTSPQSAEPPANNKVRDAPDQVAPQRPAGA